MEEKIYKTPIGNLHYWISQADTARYTAVRARIPSRPQKEGFSGTNTNR